MYWFTSDFHLNHSNIIKYSNRPFKNIEEMDNRIINNLNDCVLDNDWLFFLGDFAFTRKDIQPIINWRNEIECRNIVFICGNHDKIIRKYKDRLIKEKVFTEIHDSYLECRIEGIDFTLCHYAMRVWNKCHYGSYHLYGHSHGNLSDNPNSLSLDVGVDCFNFEPISLDEVKDIMSKKIFKPIDHHGEKNG